MNKPLALIATFLFAAPAFAQWPGNTPPSTPPPKTDAPQTTPPPPPQRRPVRDTGPRGDDGSGLGFAVRGAWAFPSGGLTGGEPLRDSLRAQLPVWVEAGYNFNKNFYAGLYFQYGFGFTECLDQQSCTSSGYRFGLEVLYNLMPDSFFQPWVGLGGGYEILNTSRSGDDRTFKGLELLNVQVGIDLAVTPKFTIGPFASYQLFGKYTSFSASGVSNDISDSTGHSWLQVGLKAGIKL